MRSRPGRARGAGCSRTLTSRLGPASKKCCVVSSLLRDTIRLGPVFADPVIVALALARSRSGDGNDYFVVTEESMRGPGSLKIPNLCQPFDLSCIRLMDAFRIEGFRFVIV